MRISDWSSDVCSSDLPQHGEMVADRLGVRRADADVDQADAAAARRDQVIGGHLVPPPRAVGDERGRVHPRLVDIEAAGAGERCVRSEEHTSELQSLMRISYAVFCLKHNKIQSTSDTDSIPKKH